MTHHCCDLMRSQTNFRCVNHSEPEDCPDALISYSAKFREYGLWIHDGGSSSINIAFCPWCGCKLPGSLRSRWFAELDALGFDDPVTQDIPEAYRCAQWHDGTASKPPASWPVRDRDGAPIHPGQRVRVLRVPDLQGMALETRAESETVFAALVGRILRVQSIDEQGNPVLCFRIRSGPLAGQHVVGIEGKCLARLLD